ncbi:MAG: flippase [Candidatus Omnitrophica bacterium]|nr:flippase [Candidatus Omnitrophota bacterium]
MKKIAKGAGIIFIGYGLGALLNLAVRVIIVRYVAVEEYGLLSLGLAITSILVSICSLALVRSIARFISALMAKGDYARVWGIIKAAIFFALLGSVISVMVVFFLAQLGVFDLLHKSGLSGIVKILALTVPFYVIVNILVSIFQGFGEVKPKVYFYNIFSYLSLIIFLGLAVVLSRGLSGVIFAYLSSTILTAVILTIYAVKNLPKHLPKAKHLPMNRELLLFSLPILGIVILNIVIHWSDTLLLGYYKTEATVGMYNAARPLSQTINFVLESTSFIFLPVISFLYSRKEFDNMRKIYVSTSKWIFAASLPIFMVLFLAPRSCIGILFGKEYLQSDMALRFLCLGFFFHTFMGLNGMTLIVIGRQAFSAINFLLGAAVNLFLNILLIPDYGLSGAAIATAVSYIIINILASVEVYIFARIHLFKKYYLRPAALSVILSLLFFSLVKDIIASNNLFIFPLAVVILLIALMSILFTKSLEKSDLIILDNISSKLGARFSFKDSKLKKFLQE